MTLEDCARMLFPQEGEAVPRLRFKGFEGEWEKKLLSDCLEISDERNTDNRFGVEDVLSVSDDYGVVNQIEHLGRSYAGKSVSGYKILRPGQIVYTKSPLSAKPFGIVKHNTGKAGIVSVLYAVYNPKEGIAPEYIHYYFDPAWRLNAYLRPLVNKGAKNTMNISDETALTGYIMIPKDIEEQRQIARFLERLDTQIEYYQQQFDNLKQLKTACIETMFPRQEESVPTMRFKGFEGKWKEAKLSTCATRITRKNTNMESDLPLTISSSEGLISQTAFFNNVVASTNMSGYYLLKKGEFAYNKSYSNGYPFGAVKKLEKYEQGALSPLYIVFSVADNIDHDYVVYFFETDLWHKEVAKRAAEGARNHGLLNIGAEDFLDINILLPTDKKEQEQIALFFRNLDTQIQSQQQQLERLKQMKQACLGLLFPDNQSITPPLRFKGFSGEWVVVMLKDICEINPHAMLPDVFEYVDLESVVGTTMVSHRTERKGTAPSRAQRLAKDGDIFFQTVRPYQRNNYLFKNEGKPFVFSTGYAQIRTTIDEGFLFSALQTDFFVNQVLDNCTGSSYPAINPTTLSNLSISISKDIKEQQRIASFFCKLDERISLHTQQVEKLKQLKQACLSQMFE